MAHTPAMANFFNSEHFAVVGASKDRSKIGNKVSTLPEGSTQTKTGEERQGQERQRNAMPFDSLPLAQKKRTMAGGSCLSRSIAFCCWVTLTAQWADESLRSFNYPSRSLQVMLWYKEHGLDVVPVHPVSIKEPRENQTPHTTCPVLTQE